MEAILTGDRGANDNAGKIRTFTGKYVDPLNMRAKDICVEDIAHHLSIINRYTGASPKPFSVAQHSVMASYYPLTLAERSWLATHDQPERAVWLARLLHDGGEYVFNDLASPVKKDPRMALYRELEHETTKLIFCVFGLDPRLLALTKPADDWMFRREAQSWWGGLRWWDRDRVWPWSARRAEHEFLNRFHELKGTSIL